MKYLLANLGANLFAIACVSCSAYMAVHDKEGWGWFLFVAVITVTTVSFKHKD